MKITKISLKLLKKHGRMRDKHFEPCKEFNYRIHLISEILLRAEVICGNSKDGFSVYNADNKAICLVDENEKSILRGMASRYSGCIECTFTHGVNQVEIINPDKLTRSIANEI